MGREMDELFEQVLFEETIQPIFLVELEYEEDTIRMWTGHGEIKWDDKTWIGTGELLTFSGIAENKDLTAENLTIDLSGVSPESLGTALSAQYRDRPARVFLGAMNESGTIKGEPQMVWEGLMDTQPIQDQGETASINVNIEHKLLELNKASDHKYTDPDQQDLYPGDRFFEFVPEFQDADIPWGRET